MGFGGDFGPCMERDLFWERKLVNGERYDDETVRRSVLIGENPYDVVAWYSEELIDLVQRCMSWDMDDRISLDQLRTEIGAAMENPPWDDAGYGEDDDPEEVILSLPGRASEFEPGKVYNGNGTKKRKRLDEDGDT
jgi:hypothetical protein